VVLLALLGAVALAIRGRPIELDADERTKRPASAIDVVVGNRHAGARAIAEQVGDLLVRGRVDARTEDGVEAQS
jgi:hypothetical protein